MDADAPLLTPKGIMPKAFLIFSMLLPNILVPLILFTSENGIVTIMVYCFICLLLVPGLYIGIFTRGHRPILAYISGEEGVKRGNIKKVVLMTIGFLVLGFVISYMVFKNMDIEKKMRIPYDITSSRQKGIVIISMLFYIPILEELFWRLFLLKSFGNYIWVSPLISIFYGTLYYSVSLFMLKWQFAMLAFICCVSLSLFLVYLKRMFRITSVVLVREGINAGLIVGFYSFLGEIK